MLPDFFQAEVVQRNLAQVELKTSIDHDVDVTNDQLHLKILLEESRTEGYVKAEDNVVASNVEHDICFVLRGFHICRALARPVDRRESAQPGIAERKAPIQQKVVKLLCFDSLLILFFKSVKLNIGFVRGR